MHESVDGAPSLAHAHPEVHDLGVIDTWAAEEEGAAVGTSLIGLLIGLVFAGSMVQPAGFACGTPMVEVWHHPGNPTRGAVAWYWGGTLRIIAVYGPQGSTVYVDETGDGKADRVERRGVGEGDVCDEVTW